MIYTGLCEFNQTDSSDLNEQGIACFVRAFENNIYLDIDIFQVSLLYKGLGFVEVERFRDYSKQEVNKIFY